MLTSTVIATMIIIISMVFEVNITITQNRNSILYTCRGKINDFTSNA